MKVVKTVIGVSVHLKGKSPIFSDECTHVLMEDEAAGPFVRLKQNHEDSEGGIKLCIEELEAITEVAREMCKENAA